MGNNLQLYYISDRFPSLVPQEAQVIEPVDKRCENVRFKQK